MVAGFQAGADLVGLTSSHTTHTHTYTHDHGPGTMLTWHYHYLPGQRNGSYVSEGEQRAEELPTGCLD